MLRLGGTMITDVASLIDSVTGLLTAIGHLMGKAMGTM
jgi:hypothetical protein